MSTTPIPAVTNTSNGVHGAHGVRGHHRRSQGTPLTGRSDSPSQSDYLAPPPHHHHHRRTPSSPLAQSFSSVDDDGHGDHEQTNSYPEPAGDGLDGPGPDADADDLPPFQGMTTTTLISPAPKGKGKGKPPAFEDRDNGDLSGPYTYTTGRRAGNMSVVSSSVEMSYLAVQLTDNIVHRLVSPPKPLSLALSSPCHTSCCRSCSLSSKVQMQMQGHSIQTRTGQHRQPFWWLTGRI